MVIKMLGSLLGGQRIDSGGMTGTPRRMAQAYAELLTPGTFELIPFPNAESFHQLVSVQHVPVTTIGVRMGIARSVVGVL
jgi:hypothetical protein